MQHTRTLRSNTTLGARLKWVRDCYDLTLEEFSERVRITKSYLSKLERDDATNPSGELLQALRSTFSISLKWLTDGDGEPFTEKELNEKAAEGLPLPVRAGGGPAVPDALADELLSTLAVTIRHHDAEDLVELLTDLARKPLYSPELNQRINGLIAGELKKRLKKAS